jgi:hypothetical protein
MVISLCCCGRNISEPDKIIDFPKMHRPPGVKVLSGNNGPENKKIGDNGGGSANYSEFSADRLTEEISGILSFN